MSADPDSPTSSKPAPASRLENFLLVLASGLGVGYLVSLVIMCLLHTWMFDAHGHPLRNDFLVFQSAGSLALHGHALSAYSSSAIHAEEVARVGHQFKTLFPWQYPPLFFFVAVLLACLPFAPAFALWVGTMVPLYGLVAALIARSRALFFAAWGTPWAILATMNGQNGFLTASIIGLVLLNLEARPLVAGLVLGLLSYKPQYAFLFPFALAFGGYWRAFAWACASTVCLTLLSCAVFGTDCLLAFAHGLGHATQDVLVAAGIGWNVLQSLYTLLRWIGVSATLAWFAQITLAIACVVFVAALWRSKSPFALKAAGLIAVIPLVTPYAFIYDFPLLTMALAFFHRQRAFDRVEIVVAAIAVVFVCGFVWHAWPGGFVASSVLALAALRRWSMEQHSPTGDSFGQAENTAVSVDDLGLGAAPGIARFA